MLYLYDNAIVNDLNKSFNPKNVPDPAVRVIDPEAAIGVVAQLQNDEIRCPIVVLNRNPATPVDTDRTNFAMMHQGTPAVFDKEGNQVFLEKVIPIKLGYTLTVLTTNTADMDEITRELMFKYLTQYFLTIEAPYEAKRLIRFGIAIRPNTEFERRSGVVEYLNQGQLYQTIIPLDCEGCVLLHYTHRHIMQVRMSDDVKITTK